MRLPVLLALLCLSFSACVRPKPVYTGSVDSINCVAIQGWGFDFKRPMRPLEIGLYDGDKLIQQITADLPRPDLLAGAKNHGFLLSPPPKVLFDHQPHTVHLRFATAGPELRGSPQKLVCP